MSGSERGVLNQARSVIGSVRALSLARYLLGTERRRALATMFIAVFQVACSTSVVAPYEPPAPAYAQPAQPDSAFAGVEEWLNIQHGADYSGFTLIDRNEEGLRWRLALIDSARHSIDFQYYLWYGDSAGRLVAARLLEAADRGVKVRVLVDDLNTLLRDASAVVLRDEVVAWLDSS